MGPLLLTWPKTPQRTMRGPAMRRMAVAVRSWTACSRVPGPLSTIIAATTAASTTAVRAAWMITTRRRPSAAAVPVWPACADQRCE